MLRPNLIANTEFDCCHELSPMIWWGDGPARDLAFLGRPSKFPVCLKSSLVEGSFLGGRLGLLFASVFLELGWPDAEHLATNRLLSLFGRVHAMPSGDQRPLLPFSVLNQRIRGLGPQLVFAFALPSTSPFLQVSHHLWFLFQLRALLVSFLRLRLTRAVVPSGFCHPRCCISLGLSIPTLPSTLFLQSSPT